MLIVGIVHFTHFSLSSSHFSNKHHLLSAPSAIYQVITNPPIAINIIDFIPRIQSFFPSFLTPSISSLLRAEVTTRATPRKGMPNRIGLTFEGVKLQPVELFGRRVDNGNSLLLPSLEIDLTWPQSLLGQIAPYLPGGIGEVLDPSRRVGGSDDVDKPGYFDVEYLDDELLVIRQQAPGGVFALVKVDSYDV